MKKRKYKSEIMMVIHQDMEAAYRVGAITEDEFHEFDGCLLPEPNPSAAESSAARSKPVIPVYARNKS
jgi:DNA-binding transcriptional regulator YiaG